MLGHLSSQHSVPQVCVAVCVAVCVPLAVDVAVAVAVAYEGGNATYCSCGHDGMYRVRELVLAMVARYTSVECDASQLPVRSPACLVIALVTPHV